MACLADYGNSNERYQKFLQRGLPPFRTLIESLLLFDKIYIPTNDFMPLGLLIGVLGEDYAAQLLDEEIVSFARFSGSIAYVGSGKGISIINIADADKVTPKFFSAPTEAAVTEILKGMPALKDPRLVKDLTLRATIEFPLENSSGELAKAVYAEIKRAPSLIKARGIVDLTRLPGLGPDHVRGLSLAIADDQDDDIFQMLRVAQSNLEANAARVAQCDDIYTSEEVAKLFRNSMSRVSQQLEADSGFTPLISIAALPDIGLLAIQKKQIVKDLISLRQSTVGIQFRLWFHQNCRAEPATVAKEYHAILKSVPFVQSALGRTIRYFAQAAAGVAALPLDPLVGLGASAAVGAVDSFIVERMFKGSSPKVFMERLEQISSKAE
jgi:hypothetical protein